MPSTYEIYRKYKVKTIKEFDAIATKYYAKAITDKRVFDCLCIAQGSGHKVDLFKKVVDTGGKVNSGIGLLLNMTSVTNPIGWGLMVTNAIARGGIAIGTEKKMMALDDVAISGGIDYPGTAAAMAFAHNKLGRKRTREALGSLPFGGLYGSGAAFKHRSKLNKGVARQQFSVILWYNAITGDKVAQRACHVLTYGKSSKLLDKHDFPEIITLNNHNKTLNDKDARKALGYYKSIMDSMKTT